MCSKYPNLHGNVTTGGFDNLAPGAPLDGDFQVRTPYKACDRLEGVTAEVIATCW
jgi:hypothetical protein